MTAASVFETSEPVESFDFVAFLEDTRPAWMADGACREYPQSWWFPERGESTARAKAVCAECLVRDECLEYALVEGERFGTWGGKSERERKRLRYRRHHPA